MYENSLKKRDAEEPEGQKIFYLYVGALNTTFDLHKEYTDLHSVSFLHYGAT